MTPHRRREPEQLIGALVPVPLADGLRPRPASMPALPAPRPPVDLTEAEFLFGVACPDRSGRLTERGLLHALHWGPGDQIHIRPYQGMLIIASSPAGRYAVGSRGELPLPAAARQMCGIVGGQPVPLTALTSHDLLVIHPAHIVARLLADLHAQVIGAHHA